MDRQLSFADLEYAVRKRPTKREQFLDTMDELIPWDAFVEQIKPYYYKSRQGRKPRGIETMLRMYLLQTWFGLSDKGLEDAIRDSYAMRRFMHLDFMRESVPDATTLYRFRKLLIKTGLAREFTETIAAALKQRRLHLRRGSLTDACLISIPQRKPAQKNK